MDDKNNSALWIIVALMAFGMGLLFWSSCCHRNHHTNSIELRWPGFRYHNHDDHCR